MSKNIRLSEAYIKVKRIKELEAELSELEQDRLYVRIDKSFENAIKQAEDQLTELKTKYSRFKFDVNLGAKDWQEMWSDYRELVKNYESKNI